MSKFLVFWLLVLHCSINLEESVIGQATSTKEKHGFGGGDVDEQLKILNKQPVKSFETKGVIVDCIDIYKQPALDHPLLKKHNIQLRPTSTPEELRSKPLSLSLKVQQPWRNAHLETYGCPEGTVPIQRTSKESLIRAKTICESFHSSASTSNPDALSAQPYVEHVAWRHSFNKTDISTPPVMHGLQAEIQIDNPAVGENQLSASILLAEGGPANLFSTIMAGWMVSPTLYGDNGTHLSVFWRDGPTNGCFNMLCPGFVQVSSTTPIGGSFNRISEYGGQAYSFVGGIYQDVKSLNWWLTIVANNVSTNVGYFPRETIPYLTTTANYIAWGGLVTTPPNTSSPPMGDGHYPDGDFSKVSKMLNLLYVDDTYTSVKPLDGRLWENRIDGCYDIKYFENYEVGKLIQFGGPGGNC